MVALVPAGDRQRFGRFGFWCVPAMAHLVGTKGTVLRPDALYSACLKSGGTVVDW